MATKNESLPGMAPAKIKELEEAADEYVVNRDARMAATKLEVQSKNKLEALMQKHGLLTYQYDEELEIEGKKQEVERTVEYESPDPKLKVRTESKEEPAE